MKKSKLFLSVICVISGIIFMTAGSFLLKRNIEFQKHGVKTWAEIVEIYTDREGDVTVYVEYEVNGSTYTSKLDYYATGLYEGQEVPILYLPDSPTEITYGRFNKVPQILYFTFGGIALSIGSAVGCVGIFEWSKKKACKNGREVSATVTKLEYDPRMRIMERHYARLVCEDEMGNRYERKFLYDARDHLQVGDQVVVYVHESDPRKYYIDVR